MTTVEHSQTASSGHIRRVVQSILAAAGPELLADQGCSDPPGKSVDEGSTTATSHPRHGSQEPCAGGGPNFPDGHGSNENQAGLAVGELDDRSGPTTRGTQRRRAAVAVSPQGINQPDPTESAPAGTTDSGRGQVSCEAHSGSASAAPTSPEASERTIAKHGSPRGMPNGVTGQAPIGTQAGRAGYATSPPAPAKVAPNAKASAPELADPLLALAADVLDDLEKVRISNENRLRQLTRDESDKDGEERGFGLTLDHPDVARLAALVAELGKAEHQAELNLKRHLRQHPLGPWVKQARGVGEKQAARLIAAIGDPYWNDLHNRPRTVSELWAYAGYHVLPVSHQSSDAQVAGAGGSGGNPSTNTVGVAATRARGQKANWSATAKMRAYLVAQSIVKAGGPYREVYDAGREKYVAAVHQAPCKRCGPAGKPAQPGSPISAGHQHARALRLVAKAVLKDLWIEARRLHGLPDGHKKSEHHVATAAGVPT